MTEHLLIGLEKIHKLLCDENGVPAMSLQTFRKKYVPSMKQTGVIFKFNIGPERRPHLCAWPSKVQLYFQILQQNKWREDENIFCIEDNAHDTKL